MKFTEILEQLGISMGLGALTLDTDNACTILFDGEHEVTFIADKHDNAVFLYGKTGTAYTLTQEDCMTLLQASLLGAGAGGAAFSIHKELDEIILWKRHDDAFPDLPALEKAINDFLAHLIVWKKKLASPLTEDSHTVDETPSGTMPDWISV